MKRQHVSISIIFIGIIATIAIESNPVFADTQSPVLKGYQLKSRLSVGGANDNILLYTSSGYGNAWSRLVVSTTGAPHSVTIPCNANSSFSVVDASGDTTIVNSGSDGLAITLTKSPQYLTETIRPGWYRLTPAVNPAGCLAVITGSPENGTKVQEWSYMGGKSQKWYISSFDDSFYRLAPAVNRNACLDVTGGAPDNCTPVQEWSWLNGQTQQLWSIAYQGDGFYRLTPGVNYASCLDVDKGLPNNGNKVQVYNYGAGVAQLWKLVPVAAP